VRYGGVSVGGCVFGCFTIADILLATVLRDIRKTDLLTPYSHLIGDAASRAPPASGRDRLLSACAGTTGPAAHAQPVRQASGLGVEISDIQLGRALLRVSARGREGPLGARGGAPTVRSRTKILAVAGTKRRADQTILPN
jgi:hypothetical protein